MLSGGIDILYTVQCSQVIDGDSKTDENQINLYIQLVPCTKYTKHMHKTDNI